MSISQITFTFEGKRDTGEIDIPTLDDPEAQESIARASRRAFWTLVASGYGDLDEVKLFHNGEEIKVGPEA